MEKLNFIKNGVSRLPPGFRFQPTDEELVFQYLKSKIFSSQLPASIIPDINVSKYDPWNLPGNCAEEERYFFSSKETKYRNGNRMNRTTNSGYWKSTGSDKKISSSTSNNGIAGVRKTLVFYEGKSPNGSRTDWVMHEYRLLNVQTTTSNSSHQNCVNEIGDWILCHVFMKKKSDDNTTTSIPKNNNAARKNVEVAQPRFFDFMRVHNSAPAPIHSSTSSSCSSSSNAVDVSSYDYEETSGYDDF